jgi:capsid protein
LVSGLAAVHFEWASDVGLISRAVGLFVTPKTLNVAPPKARAGLNGGYQGMVFPYDAADWYSSEMSEWLPWIRSPDGEINQFRDRMVARSRDLRRNDGWAAGAITRILDSTIGGAYRLSSMPDYRSLSRFAKGFDASWAEDFRSSSDWRWITCWSMVTVS